MNGRIFAHIPTVWLFMLASFVGSAGAQSLSKAHRSGFFRIASDGARGRGMPRYPKIPTSRLKDLFDQDTKMIAAYLGGRKLGVTESANAMTMPNHCTADPPISNIAGEADVERLGWRFNNERALPTRKPGRYERFASAELEVEVAFGLPLAEEAHSQPTVVGGRVFLGSDAGTVYSIDADTACVYRSFQTDGARSLDAERKAKGLPSPLMGIPFAIKDNIDVSDIPSAGGNLALGGTFSPRDATGSN